MLSTSLFKQNLNIPCSNIARFLSKISKLTGLIYLHNDGQPIIGFMPKNYFVQKNGINRLYERQRLNEYQTVAVNTGVESYLEIGFNLQNCLNNQLYFRGGYIGYFDYNLSANFAVNTQMKSQPNLYFGCYESFILVEDNHLVFYSLEENPQEIFDYLISTYQHGNSNSFRMDSPAQPRWSRVQYQHAFDKVQEYILAGDCYQINLTQEFTASAHGKLIHTAQEFWALTEAPYSGYLAIDDFEVLSCSPELFIEFQADRQILTKPIKGTMPRFDDATLDAQSKSKLENSEKDQAENLMIVDLLRNDLSIYAETGSVKTTKLFNIESFNQVHHMVSEITATLKTDVHVFDVLKAALPGGSITGAPKIRAMEIIEELEEAPRGAYCGSMGYFNFDGTGTWNILIRTLQKNRDELSLWAGGGVTIGSNSDAEYQECFDKVQAMLDLLNNWNTPK